VRSDSVFRLLTKGQGNILSPSKLRSIREVRELCDTSDSRLILVDFPTFDFIDRSIKASLGDKHCNFLELRPDALSMFSPIRSWDDTIEPPRRYSSPLPYGYPSNDHQDWREVQRSSYNLTQESYSSFDRQLVLVEYRSIVQGVYACANGGKCVAPDVCSCARGFIGFDCRTPVCEQGFYDPMQLRMTMTLDDDRALQTFKVFLSDDLLYDDDELNSERYSNPKVARVVESFVNYTMVERNTIEGGGIPYLALDGLQGGYSCSIRSVTQWENASFIHEHPNYYSRYMDSKVEDDDRRYTFWENMGWNPTHKKSKPLEISLNDIEPSFINISRKFMYTDEGYRRDGVWSHTGYSWEKGLCMVEFHRMFSGLGHRSFTHPMGLIVQDTDIVSEKIFFSLHNDHFTETT